MTRLNHRAAPAAVPKSTNWLITTSDTPVAVRSQINRKSPAGKTLHAIAVNVVAKMTGISNMAPRTCSRTCGINCITRGAAM